MEAADSVLEKTSNPLQETNRSKTKAVAANAEISNPLLANKNYQEATNSCGVEAALVPDAQAVWSWAGRADVGPVRSVSSWS